MIKHYTDIQDANVYAINKAWAALDLKDQLAGALAKEFNFVEMTPVQAATIPLMLNSKDVIVEAKTGSGKTLAFIIPIVELLLRWNSESEIGQHDIMAVILSPTRELAAQIHQVLRKILKHITLKEDRPLVSQLIVGGSSVAATLEKYVKYGGNIVIATPGRLSTIMEMEDNKLSSSIRKKLSFLILDEADQLLSMGFELNISSILNYLPKQRRTSLFSATQTSNMEELLKSGLRNPIRVDVNQLDESMKTRNPKFTDCDASRNLLMPKNLANYYHVCDSYIEKLATMTALVMTEDYKKVLVFLSTCAQIDYFSLCLEEIFKDKNLTLLKLHRRLKNKRKSIFDKFKKSKRCILLATDILSRGIDINDISLVIHVDLPTSPECYVHRSGRSGHQIESSGSSLLLVENHELDYIEMCRRRKIDMTRMSLGHLTSETKHCTDRLKAAIKTKSKNDSEFRTSGIQAFVSYIRFYTSKLCLRQLLFPKLSIAKLANSFGLLKLPMMPELKKDYKKILKDFQDGAKNAVINANPERI